MARLLIVDDEPNLRRVLSSDLRLDGHTVEEADGVTAALPLLAERDYERCDHRSEDAGWRRTEEYYPSRTRTIRHWR